MSGEQITNDSVETQNLEGELHSLKNSTKKRKIRINYFFWTSCRLYNCNWNNSFYLRKKHNIINS